MTRILRLALALACLASACLPGAPQPRVERSDDARPVSEAASTPSDREGATPVVSDERGAAASAAPPSASAPESPEATANAGGAGGESDRPGDEDEAGGGPERPGDGDASGEAADVEGEEDEPDEPERKRRVVLDTVYDDARVGQEETPAIEAELGLVENERLSAYVRSVALRLLRHAPTRPFDYEFKIVDQTVPNAFALPGGKIYVSRGLLALMTSEDELAGVLGHEITHAAERHASARLEYSKRLNPFSIGLLRAARIAAYGRDQERDADRGGQILAARAGYDPSAIAEFLRKLDASERYEIGWSRIPSFFATHPTSPERAALAIERAGSLDWTRQPAVAGNFDDAYYAMIDGLVLGPDPAGGVFDEENEFVHPELRFSLRFPRGWETMNSQQAVRAISPERDAQAELTLAGSAEDPIDEVVDAFLEDHDEGQQLRVFERRPLRIGELEAVRVRGRVGTPLGALHANLTFVAHGDLVYRLTVLSLDPNRYRGRTHAFAGSFRPIDEERMRSLKVTRLRIARALENETLQALSVRTRNELELVFTGVLNGMYASTRLDRRMPIKIGIAEPYLPRDETTEASEEPDAEGGEEAAR